MRLFYEFVIRCTGKNEKYDEFYCDCEGYIYEHEINAKDIEMYIRKNAKCVSKDQQSFYEAIYNAYQLGLFDDIERNADFKDFMHERYEEKAYEEYKEGKNE